MLTRQLCRAACEVNQILRYTEESEVNKIPIDFRRFLKDIADPHYIADINPEVSLYDQELLPETENILGMIYYYYWSDESEQDQMTSEMRKKVQDTSHEIFQDMSGVESFEGSRYRKKTELEQQALASIPVKEPWYKRLFGWFKK